MSKIELLELLRSQEAELLDLHAENRKLEEQLKDRKLEIANAGSIAEAALSVNKIFEAAQLAADQYLMNLRLRTDNDAERILRMKADMERQLEELKAKTDAECSDREVREKLYVDALWHELEKRLDEYEKAHPLLNKEFVSDLRANIHNDMNRRRVPGEESIG
jgi:hypothetical protein